MQPRTVNDSLTKNVTGVVFWYMPSTHMFTKACSCWVARSTTAGGIKHEGCNKVILKPNGRNQDNQQNLNGAATHHSPMASTIT